MELCDNRNIQYACSVHSVATCLCWAIKMCWMWLRNWILILLTFSGCQTGQRSFRWMNNILRYKPYRWWGDPDDPVLSLWELWLKKFPIVNSLPQPNSSIQLDVHVLLPSWCCLPLQSGAEILQEDTQTVVIGQVVLAGVEMQVGITDKTTR